MFHQTRFVCNSSLLKWLIVKPFEDDQLEIPKTDQFQLDVFLTGISVLNEIDLL